MEARHEGQLEKMRDFYELFPYPGRLFLFEPDVTGSVLTHAGFSAALANRNFGLCGKLVEKHHASRGRARFEEDVFRTLESKFGADKRILSVGCGTDEPLLLKKLHPQNEIVAIDLSQKSLRRARLKLFLFGLRSLPSRLVSKSVWANVALLCGDAAKILASRAIGKFDHIQCFGVLHHQPKPEVLFAQMAAALNTGGTLRLMIYSCKGRRLERRIQKRFEKLWDYRTSFSERFAIRKLHFKLFLWQILNFIFPFSQRHARFRYLGVSGVSVADALLHPSDPGLSISSVVEWAHKYGFKFIYCEAKTNDEGWVRKLVNVEHAVQRLSRLDADEGLLSNFTCILKKEV